jgi:alkanesulfonate monooxygenase SsuD/methylene tetrahydromethanopterin reductase-like flavin-dependent oxidoreductase (luciferase family)
LASPEQAAGHPYTDAERSRIDELRRAAFVGTAAQVAARLDVLAERLTLGEIVINTWTHDPAARRRSYELLAAAFGLGTDGRVRPP